MTQRCEGCGRPLAPARATCLYCGGAPLPAEDHDAPVDCPRCQQPMERHAEDSVVVDRCGRCGGTWFDRGELEANLARETAPPPAPRPDRRHGPGFTLDDAAVVYLSCPRCGQPMTRRNYGRVSGVMTDVCGYHGVFLDAGELERIRAFRAAGGEAVAAAREAQDATSRPRTPIPGPTHLRGGGWGWSDLLELLHGLRD